LPEEIKATDLHSDVRADLLSLARPVADTVARHLVATGLLIDEDPAAALAHAMAARRLAPRIAAVREASGLAAYHAADWQTAIAELRTYHRLTGRQTHLAILADCERALGRPERAIDLFRSADRSRLDPTEAIELLIVAAGARGDLGQHAAAVAMLQVPELSASGPRPAVARLRYAFADALLSVGRREEAREWFSRAVEADEEATTDAAERLLELDGVLLSGDEDGEFVDGDGTGDGADEAAGGWTGETAKTDDESGETGGTGETAGTGDETDEIDGTGETDETGDDGTDEDDEDGFADEDATDDEDGFADDGGFAEQDTDTDDDSFGARQAEDGLDEDSEDDDRDTDAVVEDREHDIPGSTRPQPDA
jgi:tetratricopeptide (TPR) repeat protein